MSSLSAEVNNNDLNKALADNDAIKAKQIMCEMEEVSKSECKGKGNSSIVAKTVATLLKEKMYNPRKTITNIQVDKAKQGICLLLKIILITKQI